MLHKLDLRISPYIYISIIRMIVIVVLLLVGNSAIYGKTRIKDIASVEGVRDNLLVGRGLIVGLPGTGDNLQNTVFTQKGLADFLERLGMNVHGANIKTKNIATVTVTANFPAFASRGSRIDVKVSSLGDAKSLKDGVLLPTPLVGADGNVYAVAQGAVTVSNFVPVSADVKIFAKAIETNGYIKSGAIVEDEIDFAFTSLDSVKLALHSPDFNTALSVAQVINNNIEGNTAVALDPGTVELSIPSYQKENLVDLMSRVENLEVMPHYKAKIIINQASGTVVIGDNVRIRPVAIAQGNLVVNVGQINMDEKYNTQNEPEQRDILHSFVDKKRGVAFRKLDKTATLSELVSGLNKLGVYPNDIIDILHNMKDVGALDALIEVK